MRLILTVCCTLIGLASFAAVDRGVAQSARPLPNPDASGPQTTAPAPLPPGQADVPGGTSRDGVVEPPATTSGATRTIQPPQQGAMPVIPPPGTAGNRPDVRPE